MKKKLFFYLTIGLMSIVFILISCSKDVVDKNQTNNELKLLNLRTQLTENDVQYDINEISNINVVRVMFFLEHNKVFKNYLLGELGRLKLLSTIDLNNFNNLIQDLNSQNITDNKKMKILKEEFGNEFMETYSNALNGSVTFLPVIYNQFSTLKSKYNITDDEYIAGFRNSYARIQANLLLID
jgi:hypothetical protein